MLGKQCFNENKKRLGKIKKISLGVTAWQILLTLKFIYEKHTVPVYTRKRYTVTDSL